MKIKFKTREEYDEQPSIERIPIEAAFRNGRHPQEVELEYDPLFKIYESPKTMLRKNLEVIEMAVQEQLELVFNDYIEWRRGRARRPDYIFNMIQDIAFVSVLPKIVKSNYEFILDHGEEFSELISAAVGELTKRNPPLSKSRDMIAIYSNIYEDLNEDRIKKVVKMDIPGVEWADALKLCIVSHGSPSHTVIHTLRAIYASVKSVDYKEIRKLFTKLYGKHDMDKVAVYILLERAYDKQRTSWINRELHSVITNIALDELERRTIKEITQLLKLYCNERRRTEFDQYTSRRIRFSSISKDEYRKITKAVKKLSKKNDMYRLFLDQTRVKN